MSMSTKDERFERLPKWAREEVQSLRREVARAQHEAKEARLATEDPSSVMFLKEVWAREPIALPASGRIVFKTPTGEIRVRFDPAEGNLNIMANAENGGALVVRPHVSNVVTVQIVEGL